MTRYDITSKTDYRSGTGDYHCDVINYPLVGCSLYGKAEFTWASEQNHAIVMHVVPSTAKVVSHEIFVLGFTASEDITENYFYVSNCYYLAPVDYFQDGSLKHHQYLSIEAVDSPTLKGQYLHKFPDPTQEPLGPRPRVVGYNAYNYSNYTAFKAPYVHECMHYQYLSLADRFVMDFPVSTAPAQFYLTYDVRGRSVLTRPLVFVSRLQWYN